MLQVVLELQAWIRVLSFVRGLDQSFMFCQRLGSEFCVLSEAGIRGLDQRLGSEFYVLSEAWMRGLDQSFMFCQRLGSEAWIRG